MKQLNSRYLAIVPARSGSKRTPDKNIADIAGEPLFTWSVRAGNECPHIGETFVSTDSSDYQRIAIKAGAQCPVLRSAELSTDLASSADVVLDVLDWYWREQKRCFDYFVLLQPTSPLRTADDVSKAIQLREKTGACAVVSVCETDCPPAWVGKLDSDLSMDNFIDPKYQGVRSQDLGTFYRLNGAIYVINTAMFMQKPCFIPQGTLAYIMPRSRSIDIDTPYDLQLARLLTKSNIVE